jgi:hypothetical protein
VPAHRFIAARYREPTVIAAVAVVSAVVAASRVRGGPIWSTLWAEDGAVFLRDAWDRPLSALAWKPYAGYLNTVPRVVAESVTHLPVPMAAGAMAVLSAVIVVGLALLIVDRTRQLLSRPITRVLLAAVVVAGPATTTETFGNATNLNGYLAAAAVFVLWAPPRRRDVVGVVVCLLAAVTTPLAALALVAPVWNVAAGARRAGLRRALLPGRHYALGPCLALVLGLAVQAGGMVGQVRGSGSSLDLVGWLSAVAVRVGPASLLGPYPTQALVRVTTVPLLTAVCLLLLLPGWRLLAERLGVGRALQLAVTGVGVLAVSLLVNWVPNLAPSMSQVRVVTQGRYDLIPGILAWLSLLVVVDASVDELDGRRLGRLFAMAPLALAGLVIVGLAVPSRREGAPDWPAAVQRAAVSCHGVARATIEIAPAGWTSRPPCALVIADERRQRP